MVLQNSADLDCRASLSFEMITWWAYATPPLPLGSPARFQTAVSAWVQQLSALGPHLERDELSLRHLGDKPRRGSAPHQTMTRPPRAAHWGGRSPPQAKRVWRE